MVFSVVTFTYQLVEIVAPGLSLDSCLLRSLVVMPGVRRTLQGFEDERGGYEVDFLCHGRVSLTNKANKSNMYEPATNNRAK
jgi:hypothetical protein